MKLNHTAKKEHQKMKALQEAFSIMYKHLHSMKEMSTDESGENGMYRGCNGNKCPVGALIDDKHYSEEIEGKAVSSDIVLEALELSGCPTTQKSKSKLKQTASRSGTSDFKSLAKNFNFGKRNKKDRDQLKLIS